ncbi:MAG: helix-turn-helix transcriptional regulator [Methylobacteriaceae bacterium]|nr:helix-turn-helix transcriptional regulator [Methylobacteriaceae bacterium]
MNRERAERIATEWKELATIFAALGDSHRQRMLLLFDVGEELPVGAVASAVQLSPTAAAHHINILRQAGILKARRAGRATLLSVDRNLLSGCLEATLAYVRDESGGV